MNYDEIIEFFKLKGFRRIGVEGAHKTIMISNNHKLQITIEENIDKLTAEDEERIKCRLKELGYL